VPIILSRYTQI